jgi:hypothetical protein
MLNLKRQTSRSLCLLALGVFTLFTDNRAEAASFFSADASSSLIVKGVEGLLDIPSDLLFSGTASILLLDKFSTPGATSESSATASVVAGDPDAMDIDDYIDQEAHVAGTASPTGSDYVLATADALTDGYLKIANTSATASYTVLFDFVWEWAVETGADDPLRELAFAATAISVGYNDKTVPPLVPPFFETLGFSDTVFGGGAFSDSGLFSFDLFLAPGETIDLWVVNDAFGDAAVPEPGTLVLLASGLVGLVVCRVRRRLC